RRVRRRGAFSVSLHPHDGDTSDIQRIGYSRPGNHQSVSDMSYHLDVSFGVRIVFTHNFPAAGILAEVARLDGENRRRYSGGVIFRSLLHSQRVARISRADDAVLGAGARCSGGNVGKVKRSTEIDHAA